ncbi:MULTISPECIES: adenosylcobinamide-phosphate synthase CbiB [Commensalibacter]|uniref:adenosylcobinamide-phosphate synthase CbiB n=1 Tax=Commensalibacter TaxID=1079922 RepID=UPI0018DD5117|nr:MULTISPECIES: adenosylcobinamide-phosphate synthase CbiB [Commensalibacter]MBH9973359.1 cobalamin biosynthesis protein CobD [Commensalibacter melissae]MBI0016035.1 cobalamin biosynthesis protein CobD [Commensalibacter sp. B14384M2]MBI0017786.1 cobalamin biosynthesis protein CobD [Commensalibacter sp. W8133]MBI0048908.1 cobalamin biosynthesis protein CobD [Commensalibacter sp. B14384M3]MBI0178564.1 cobalamin biosynthesis protein CobD [Commensalibacter sp. W8163]
MIKILNIFYRKRNIEIMIIALMIDMIWGDPEKIYKKIPHPICYVGKLIHFLELKLNKKNKNANIQKRNGFITLFFNFLVPGLIAHLFQKFVFAFFRPSLATFLSGIFGSIFIAHRSLYEHVHAVREKIDQNDLAGARIALSHIVGRKTDNLNMSEICCATIESLAENFSDGVISPVFWGYIGGLPGLLVFKSINTADSMIGHLTEQYRNFGYASAKMDDYMNLVPARLSALLILLTNPKKLFHNLKPVCKDARKHNSPNAGWPEAAMAYTLNIQLLCPRHYKDHIVESPRIGRERSQLYSEDICKACKIYYYASFIKLIILIALYKIMTYFK